MAQQDGSTALDMITRMMARELDSRTSDGMQVRLLWRPLDNNVSVAVNDARTGEAFQVDVRPGQRALDVFHHPYAYATQLLTPGPEWRVDRLSWSAGGW
jgi:hypothetical protein